MFPMVGSVMEHKAGVAAALIVALGWTAAPTRASAQTPTVVQPGDPAPGPFEESTFASTVLMESRRVIVRLPRRYAGDPSRRYPVVYKLDGTNGLAHYHETIGILTSLDLMPDVIVVALPNGRGTRNRDLTPPTLHQEGGEDGAEGAARWAAGTDSSPSSRRSSSRTSTGRIGRRPSASWRGTRVAPSW
jgi:hypothetical protein